MSSSGIGMPEEDRTKKTWLFSQLIDLDELPPSPYAASHTRFYNKNNAKQHNRNICITNKHFQSAAGYAKLRKNAAGGI